MNIDSNPRIRSPKAGYDKRLKAAMDKKGIFSPAELARSSGLNPVTVAAYCRGTRGFSLEAAFHMGQALGADPMYLFHGNAKSRKGDKDFLSHLVVSGESTIVVPEPTEAKQAILSAVAACENAAALLRQII